MADDALQHKFPGQRAYPPQFRGKDRLDWDSNPMGDQEWIWQLHRFYWWESLGRAWLVTREEKYAREWVFELNSWIDHMHKKENFEKHPGWRPLETGTRLTLFPKMAEYFQEAAAFDSYAMINLLWTMGKHVVSVEKRMSGMNNHRMHEWDGLLTFLLQYPEYRGNAERTRAIYDDIVKSQRILMLPDGVINEFIPSYHNGNVAQFLAFRKRAERYGFPYHFPEDYDRIIQNGVTAVMLWSHPDGSCPQFGDAWHKMLVSVKVLCKNSYENIIVLIGNISFRVEEKGKLRQKPSTYLNQADMQPCAATGIVTLFFWWQKIPHRKRLSPIISLII